MITYQQVTLQIAEDHDLQRIINIWTKGWYKVHPNSSISEYQLSQFTLNFERRKFPYEFWIVKIDDTLAGWVSVLPAFYHPMKEKSDAEISIYIDDSKSNTGLGTKLTSHVLKEIDGSEIKTIWAFVSRHNLHSKQMCQKAGLTICGGTSKKFLMIKEYKS